MFSNPQARKSVDSLPPLSPSSRPDFPHHRQPSVTSHPAPRRGSTASSIHSIHSLHSIGSHLETSSTWSQTVLETGQNAISTLLQPPIVRTGLLPHTSAPASSTHKPPTARDIPPVTLTNIPHIDAAEFKPYLTQVGALYEQLRRVKESDDDGSEHVFGRTRMDEFSSVFDDGHLKPSSRPSSSRKVSAPSTRSLSPIDSPPLVRPTRRRSSSGLGRKSANQGPPPLSTIPNVYFDEDFHLENPRTFDVVSERSEVVRPPPGSVDEKNAANGSAPAPRKALATNAILQEKLSWYMDTIEMHLISSISTASTTFFTTLGSLRELHSEAADSVERIRTLRRELQTLDREIATTGLDIIQKQRRRENLRQLNDTVKQLREIVESVAACEALVDEGEAEKALTNIDSLEKLIAGTRITKLTRPGKGQAQEQGQHAPQLRDLRDAVALQGVNGDISALRFRIGKAFETKFIDVLIGDLRHYVDTVPTQEVLLRWSSSAMRSRGAGPHSRESSAYPSYLADTEDLRSQLVPIFDGLHSSKHVSIAIASYREMVLREIRNLIKRPLPTSNDDDSESIMSASTLGSKRLTPQEKSSILARNLRALDERDAEALFVKIYISVTETLRRLGTQVKVLFDVVSSMGQQPSIEAGLKSPPPLKSPPLNNANRDLQEDIHMTMDMANLLGQAVDISQDKIVKVLRVRNDQSTHLPLAWFLRYFTLNLYFTNECEAISGRSGTALKSIVNSQIKEFIQSHGDAEKQKLAQGMESDQWAAKDFTEYDTVLLNRVLECSTKDNAAWLEDSKIYIPFEESETDKGASSGRPRSESNAAAKEKPRSAVIDLETFILPNSAILCLEGMSHFLHLISGIPSMASDISTSLISYLQLFNSRCTQLILGAGATRSAGLKNITTRHLALASQALAFISTLILHVREFVRRHAGSGPHVNNANVANLMNEFGKVRRLFQEHQNSIYDKLVEIMSGRAAAHAKSMKAINWDVKTEETANPYMETLVKETVTLHRVLTKHLPEGTVRLIMTPVFESYKAHLGKTLQGLESRTETSINRMRADIDYLNNRLGKIDGFGDTYDHLIGIVKLKKPEQTAPESSGIATAAVTTDPEVEKTEKSDDIEAKEEGKPERTSNESKEAEAEESK
ncbi:putative GARP complex component [Durotheca rogersii]|uniref:putative GARP complex component n=1 Tax=Durotheca rogersii TaxID=419775 RepID=UPI002221105F|nr:putative GARP complex component [Durotheca rogersii]KAI5867251.1 putative GARP complex component [Durotheca rogersii]